MNNEFIIKVNVLGEYAWLGNRQLSPGIYIMLLLNQQISSDETDRPQCQDIKDSEEDRSIP